MLLGQRVGFFGGGFLVGRGSIQVNFGNVGRFYCGWLLCGVAHLVVRNDGVFICAC